MTDRELMQQALEALDYEAEKSNDAQAWLDIREGLREMLSQQEQEPVAWMVYTEGGTSAYVTDNPNDLVGAYRALSLYTTLPRREWVGLTDEERRDIREWKRIQEELGPVWAPMMLYLYEAIEAKLKGKNT